MNHDQPAPCEACDIGICSRHQPSPDRAAVEQILIDYSRVRQYTFQEATDAILSLLEKARRDELIKLARAHWQKPIPELAVLDRIKALSKGADKE